MNLETHRSHALFDVESAIIANRNQPSPVDLRSYQERIDKAVGKDIHGRSLLRVVWGQAVTHLSFGRHRMKYPFYRYEEGGEIHDIGIPRFFVEELHSNAELNQSGAWEKTRWQWVDGQGKVDVLGAIPEEGFYTLLFPIAYHDRLCCNGREFLPNGETCYGAYRPPTDHDLQRIRRMKWRRDHGSNAENNPSDSQIRRNAERHSAQRDEMWQKNISERVDDFLNTHGWRFSTDDPSALANGKYHFLGGHNRSGLTANQLANARKELKNGSNANAA